MRILAAIYLTIMLVNFGIWFVGDPVDNPFPTPYSYLMWVLFGLSVLALLAFVIDKRILPRKVWQAVFVLYLGCRSMELLTTGLPLVDDDLVANLNAVSSYLWLVLPAALAMGYLAFSPCAVRAAGGLNAGVRLTATKP